MISCSNCGKENQDHYKFCLGCGSKLEGPAPAPTPAPNPAPPGVATTRGLSGSPTGPGEDPIAPSQTPPTTCRSCGLKNPVGFVFCGRCGNKLTAAAKPAPAPTAPAGAPRDMGSAHTVFVDNAPVPAPPAKAAPAPQHRVKLIMLGNDGQPMGERMISGEALQVGRNHGAPWDDDAYLDPEHATLTAAHDGLQIQDVGSLNGIFFRLEGRTDLRDGDVFRVGQELLQYEDLPEPSPDVDGTERMGSPNPGYWGRIKTIVEPGRASGAWPIESDSFTVGRESGDLSFPQDGYVSGTHCRVFGDDNGVYLEDLGSSNGTYVRVRTGDRVPFGRTVLIGQRLFRIEQP